MSIICQKKRVTALKNDGIISVLKEVTIMPYATHEQVFLDIKSDIFLDAANEILSELHLDIEGLNGYEGELSMINSSQYIKTRNSIVETLKMFAGDK
jgi:hypothetical protein